MEYISTRNKNLKYNFKDIFFRGLAPDGGLFIPKQIKKYNEAEIKKLSKLNYVDLATEILFNFCSSSLEKNKLNNIIKKSYKNFSSKEVIKLKKFGNLNLIELYHGPTLAFKDIAMQVLGNMYDEFNISSDNKVNIIVATSGDTGSAAIAALKEKKIGIVKDLDLSSLNNDVVETYQNSLKEFESMGAQLIDISLPNISLSVPTYYVVAPAECSSNLSRFDGVKFGMRSEDAKDLEELYVKTRSEGFGDEVKRRILIGSYVLSAGYYDAYYKKAQQVRRLIKNDFDNAFKTIDVIMTPTTRGPAFKIGSKGDDPIQMYLEDLFTISANLAGLPAMSLPNGNIENKPIGLQIIGNFLDESTILNFAHMFQNQTNWHMYTPEGIKQ